jgi:hypothetical protein
MAIRPPELQHSGMGFPSGPACEDRGSQTTVSWNTGELQPRFRARQEQSSVTSLISKAVVDAMVSYAADEGLCWLIPGDSGLTIDGGSMTLSAASKRGQTAIGQVLIEQNAFSLEAVFGRDSAEARQAFDSVEAYRPSRFPLGLIDAVAVVDAVAEYEEQVAGSDQWEMSLGAWITARIMSRAARTLARSPELFASSC